MNLEDVRQGDPGKRKMVNLDNTFLREGTNRRVSLLQFPKLFSPHSYVSRKQSEVQCLAQGHFDVWTGGAYDLLSHSSIFDFTACSASMKRWR